MSQEKVNKLIEGVLETMPEYWDNPNGGYRYSCPFCQNYKEVGGGESVSMIEIDHSEDCVYLTAQELKKEQDEQDNEHRKGA
jgi:hypothetical protein